MLKAAASDACVVKVKCMQAVADGGAAEDLDTTETDYERRKRLRSDDNTTNSTLAYDKEQQALRDALIAKGEGAGTDSSGEGEGGIDEEHGGLKVRRRVTKVRSMLLVVSSWTAVCVSRFCALRASNSSR
jgi:hypothetical protein